MTCHQVACRPRSGKEQFTFGIPLIARRAAIDWARVSDLLELTLRSVLSQTDGDFRLLLAGHDEPESWKALAGHDFRFQFLRAEWPPETPNSPNDDGGRKKWLIKQAVREYGGGLLMYLDADDLVDRCLVETARAMIGSDEVGAIVDHGVAIDFASLHAVRLPDTHVFDGAFHRLCGSSTIGRIDPGSPNPLRRDPHERLGSHHLWWESARKTGATLARLPVWGAYLVNTSENHSELHGPFADWRQTLNRAVTRKGTPVDAALAARFGLDLDTLLAKVATKVPARLS